MSNKLSIFDLDFYNTKMEQDAKDWVESNFPEHYYGDILVYEAWSMRSLLEMAYMAGKTSKGKFYKEVLEEENDKINQ